MKATTFFLRVLGVCLFGLAAAVPVVTGYLGAIGPEWMSLGDSGGPGPLGLSALLVFVILVVLGLWSIVASIPPRN